jgi:putative ABC transport system permease protein
MTYRERLASHLRSIFSDCRFALRQFRKSPGFVAVAVFTLALGIGSSTAIFSVIDAVLLNPYPYKNADRLATFSVFSAEQFRAWRFPAAAFVDFKRNNHTFEDMFGLVWRNVHLMQTGATRELLGASATPSTFESLGVPPIFGRSLTDQDAQPGAPPVFVVSFRLWTNLFHRDTNILGTTHTLNGQRMTVVGVMPPRFQIGGFDLWMPLNITRDTFVPGSGIQSNEIWIVGHLKRGVSPELAAADLQAIAAPFQKEDPIYFPPHFKIVVNTLNSQSVAGDFKFGLFALMAAVTVLLLIACGNVANLLLARATTRVGELGVRSALGASRFRLIRQLLVESFLLAFISCALGWLFAYFGLKAIVLVIPPNSIPPEAVIALSRAALLFAVGATTAVSVICGLAPAFYAFRLDSQTALSSAGKAFQGSSHYAALRNSLVVIEVALAIVLSICSGLIMRSLFALQNVNLGFNPSQLVYENFSWPEGRYQTASQKHLVFRRVLDRITQLPGVRAATESTSFPPYTFGWTTVAITGKTPPQNRNTASIFCTDGYFQTLGLPLLRGTLFSRTDIDSARHVVIVNQTFVRQHFGKENPIGRQVRFSDFETLSDWPRDPYFEIVGVVADARNTGLQDPPRPEIYLPSTLTAGAPAGIMVSTDGSPAAVLQQLHLEISQLDPDLAIGDEGTVGTLLDHSYFARPRFLLTTLSIFAVIALILVAVGISSVVSYSVVLRTREIGIRMALGAQTGQILSLVVRKGLEVIATGITLGLIVSFFLTRLLSSQIWGVSATDPLTFAVVSSAAFLIGVLACLFPARRASHTNPLVALRWE